MPVARPFEPGPHLRVSARAGALPRDTNYYLEMLALFLRAPIGLRVGGEALPLRACSSSSLRTIAANLLTTFASV